MCCQNLRSSNSHQFSCPQNIGIPHVLHEIDNKSDIHKKKHNVSRKYVLQSVCSLTSQSMGENQKRKEKLALTWGVLFIRHWASTHRGRTWYTTAPWTHPVHVKNPIWSLPSSSSSPCPVYVRIWHGTQLPPRFGQPATAASYTLPMWLGTVRTRAEPRGRRVR